jgi:large subunit ribosomal protein L25
MLQFEVEARTRKNFGKGAARQLRRSGKTPAVLYGAGNDNMPLEVETKPFTKTLLNIQDQNAVITLNIADVADKKVHHVIVQEVQVDPVRDSLIHADFLEIDLDKPLVLAVPLKFKGKAKGVDMGGEMHISRHHITVRGKAFDIPNDISIDVSGLGVGAKVTCGDLDIPGSITLQDKADAVIVSVQEASAAAAKTEEEAGEEV